MKRRAVTLLLWVFVALTGCSGQQVRPLEQVREQWEARRAYLEGLQRWHLTGRVAAAVGAEGWTATLRWRQVLQDYRIDIIGPLGQGSMHLAGSPAGVTVRSSEAPEPVYAEDAEALLAQQFGWHVPVNSLRFWVVGLPDPALGSSAGQLRFNQAGELLSLRQDAWQVKYLSYQGDGPARLPRKVFIENKADAIRLRLVIQRWQTEG